MQQFRGRVHRCEREDAVPDGKREAFSFASWWRAEQSDPGIVVISKANTVIEDA